MLANPTAISHHDVVAASESPATPATANASQRGPLHLPRRRQAGCDQPDRADPHVVGATHAVGVVVGVVHANLQSEAHHERQRGTPPRDRSVSDRTPDTECHRDDRGGQRAGTCPFDPAVHRGVIMGAVDSPWQPDGNRPARRR